MFDAIHPPALNACLNGTATILLLGGFTAIRTGRRRLHAAFMLSTFIVSILFLISYLTYHLSHPATSFGGQGVARAIYLAMLLTHMILAAVVPPLAVAAIWLAIRRRFDKHKRLVRWLLPMWLYVSVTGVIIYLMLRPYYA